MQRTTYCMLNNETHKIKIHLRLSRVEQPYVLFPINSYESSWRIGLLLLGKKQRILMFGHTLYFRWEKRIPLKKARICSECNVDYEPKHFAYAGLAELEDEGQVFLAQCLHCSPNIDKRYSSQALRKCVACNKVKDRKEFSLERQRWRPFGDKDEDLSPIARTYPNL